MPLDPDQLSRAADDVARSPFTAGLLGAVVTALRGMPGTTWGERISHSVAGALMAGHLGPGIGEWFGLTGQSMLGATSFLVGMFGLNISAGLWAYFKSTGPADWFPWLRGKGGE